MQCKVSLIFSAFYRTKNMDTFHGHSVCYRVTLRKMDSLHHGHKIQISQCSSLSKHILVGMFRKWDFTQNCIDFQCFSRCKKFNVPQMFREWSLDILRIISISIIDNWPVGSGVVGSSVVGSEHFKVSQMYSTMATIRYMTDCNSWCLTRWCHAISHCVVIPIHIIIVRTASLYQ